MTGIAMFDLSSLTPRQRAITEDAINRTSFDFTRLAPELLAEKRRTMIPVEWVDLTTHAARAAGDHSGEFDPLLYREAALGLAWYSGRISIEVTLESNPALAIEVFLAEGAHMVDFFLMSDQQRVTIFNAYHAGDTTEHGHGWFDKSTYWDFVGESFMSGFIRAFSDAPVTILSFSHQSTPAVVATIRDLLGDEVAQPPPDPEDPPMPDPVVEDVFNYPWQAPVVQLLDSILDGTVERAQHGRSELIYLFVVRVDKNGARLERAGPVYLQDLSLSDYRELAGDPTALAFVHRLQAKHRADWNA